VLHILQCRVDVKVVDTLLKAGADINAVRDRDGRTPLLAMIAGHNSRIWVRLPEYGADCNAQDLDGNTALHFAMTHWGMEPDLVKQWLEAGANPNIKNNLGQTCLFSLRFGNDPPTVDNIILYLVEASIDLEARDHRGRGALLHFARNHETYIVRKLLEHGATATVRDFEGKTIIHSLARSRIIYYGGYDEDMARLQKLFKIFIKAGVDPRAVDHAGNTTLHDAVESCHSSDEIDLLMVKATIKTGVSSNAENHQGRTALHCASALPHNMSDASRFEGLDESCLGLLLQPTLCINVDSADHEGHTALHIASSNSDVYVWQLICARANVACKTREGRTPLHFAARARRSNIVGLISQVYNEHSWSVDQADSYGRTPLHDAARSGRPESVSFLLACGANPNVKDRRAVHRFTPPQNLKKTQVSGTCNGHRLNILVSLVCNSVIH